jgi:hypothetical protein
MASTSLNLFNPFIADPDVHKLQAQAQEVVYYGESRFRSILIACNQADVHKKTWMAGYIHRELVGHYQIMFQQILM